MHGPHMVCPVAGGTSLQGPLAAQDKGLVFTSPLPSSDKVVILALVNNHETGACQSCGVHLGFCPNLTNDCIVIQARLLWRVKVPPTCV